MNFLSLLLLLPILFSSQHAAAQEDTTFIGNYKAFRELVDSLKSFEVLLVPYQSTKAIKFNESIQYWKEAYHFLKNKKNTSKSADFKLAVLIDDVSTEDPILNETYLYNYTSKEDRREILIKTKYWVTFNILVYTKDGKHFQYKLSNQEMFTKLVKRQHDAQAVGADNSLQQDLKDNKIYRPDIDDFRQNVISILRRYRNYYIDRVDQ